MENPQDMTAIRRARKNFLAMAGTYSLGVFNDQFFKQAAMLTAVAIGLDHIQGYATVIFALPFILFAAPAGWAADRFSKRTVVVSSKGLELLAMTFGALGIWSGSWPLILIMLAIMALQSTMFSPALNGSIPELYPEDFVIKVNARLKVITTAAILAGVALAGIALDDGPTSLLGASGGPRTVALTVLAVAAMGFAVSFGVPRRPAAAPGRPFPWSGPLDTIKILKSTGRDPLLAISIGADAVFWFVGALQILLINKLGIDQFGFSKSTTSCLAAAELIGVAAGGLLSGRISHGRRWFWILAPSAFALGLLMVLVAFVPLAPGGLAVYLLFALLLAAGTAGGMFYIPLQAFIQVRPRPERKGAILAAANCACFIGILLSGPIANLLNASFNPTNSFGIAGLLLIAMSIWLAAVWNRSSSRGPLSLRFIFHQVSAPIDTILRIAVKFLLWLRYSVRIKGLEKVADAGTRGILFLPNHPAFIDPFIVASTLHRWFAPRFLADRDQIDRFFIRWAAHRWGVRPIPDASKYLGAQQEIEKVLHESIEGLKKSENLLFYPAGRINHSRLEDLGGKSALETILREAPDVRVVLVRTRGLWGSIFSRAWGHHPVVPECMKKAVKSLALSGIFFAPRRKVTIEFVEPPDLPRRADRFTLNRYLEKFYNEDAPHNTYVPYTIWEKGTTRVVPEPPAETSLSVADVPPDVRRKVLAHLQEATGRKSISDDEFLGRDLGLDSLTMVELLTWLESEFAAANVDVQSLRTVRDVLSTAAGRAVGAPLAELKDIPPAWFQPETLFPVAGATITEAFLHQAARAPSRVIVADQISGAKTYRQLATAICALKAKIAKIPGSHVGVMLPASVAADVVYMACLFAGKVPVMVNWTVGTRQMAHSLDLLDVRTVITAKTFADRVEFMLGPLDRIKERFLHIENLARSISPVAKLSAWLTARFALARMKPVGQTDPAVVLFTSGSETLPKAVPLTHANILTNVTDVLSVVNLTENERIVGLFPPFHSFGMTCTVLMPLCSGVRVFYHPNPTEGPALARLIQAYKGTMLLGTPTFLSGILHSADQGQLQSLRLVVSGADKCPQAVYEAFAARCPNATLLEGYGVSECSPVVSVNDADAPAPFTIGKVLPSFEYAIVGVESGLRTTRGDSGVLLVRGPSVFAGYANYDGPSPFVEFEGKTWYRTGDLVCEDADGVLSFSGRLKRFIKLGGEMISLPAIEAVLEPLYPPIEGKPAIAVEATPSDERPEIVLFATSQLDRAEVNRQIRNAGLSALHSVRRIVPLDEIPLLGSGKVDYRSLKATLKS